MGRGGDREREGRMVPPPPLYCLQRPSRWQGSEGGGRGEREGGREEKLPLSLLVVKDTADESMRHDN